jgi:hypothetical protein
VRLFIRLSRVDLRAKFSNPGVLGSYCPGENSGGMAYRPHEQLKLRRACEKDVESAQV